jgi:hypothetical protein
LLIVPVHLVDPKILEQGKGDGTDGVLSLVSPSSHVFVHKNGFLPVAEIGVRILNLSTGG